MTKEAGLNEVMRKQKSLEEINRFVNTANKKVYNLSWFPRKNEIYY